MSYSEEIVALGTDDDVARTFEGVEVDKKIDASGCCILPGKILCLRFFNNEYSLI